MNLDEDIYLDKGWVIIDNGEDEKKIISDLKITFSKWNTNNFQNLVKHDFEEYYPEIFNIEIESIRNLKKNIKEFENKFKEQIKKDIENKKKELQEMKNNFKYLKTNLNQKVITWTFENKVEAIIKWANSADEIINLLLKIEQN